MEKLVSRYTATQQALESFRDILDAIKEGNTNSKSELAHMLESERIARFFRDSSIQRFEYCSDLLWKYLKDYLEIELEITPELKNPKGIIRACCSAGALTEQETIEAIQMIEDRNISSHIYREEIAQIIAKQLPGYYMLMMTILQKTKPASSPL